MSKVIKYLQSNKCFILLQKLVYKRFLAKIKDPSRIKELSRAIMSTTTHQQQTQFQKHVQTLKQSPIIKVDSFLLDLVEYLEKNYPEGQTKINLGSMFQIPIQAKGVDLLMKYCYWPITMLNLTMHKIQNNGLQSIIKHGLQAQQNQETSTFLTLTQLSIIKNNLTSDGFKDIEKLKLPRFKILRATGNNIDHVAIYKIIKAQWPQFQQLELSNNKIGKQGCRLLMMSNWKKFRKLDLNYNLIGNEGLHYLSEANWPQLVEINLSNNKIDAQGTHYIKAANWPQLKTLIMNRNQVGMTKGRITLTGCSNLCQLKTHQLHKLSLYGNEITLNGIKILLQSQKLAPGCWLQLSRNHFKFQDIRELLKQLDRFCNQFEN